MHYDEVTESDVAYCHVCIMGFKQKRMRNSQADPAFVSDSFAYVLLYTPPIVIMLGFSARCM
jgi:hypothetical protein